MKNIPVRYISDTKREKGFVEDFNIRALKDILKGKDFEQERHRHDYFYILALKKGRGNHEIDFTSYPIRNHSVFFLRPGQVHQLQLKYDSTGYLMQFKTDFYYPTDKASAKLLHQVSNQKLCVLPSKSYQKLEEIMRYMHEECGSKKEGYNDVVRANLSIFFIELVRQRQHNDTVASTYVQRRLEEFLLLMEAHIVKHKQVAWYADKMNLSAYQLNAITKEALGKSSSELINEHIILESKRYLLATTNQVTQIAYHLGYDDVSYFIRFFKRHTGHSPEAFRQNFK